MAYAGLPENHANKNEKKREEITSESLFERNCAKERVLNSKLVCVLSSKSRPPSSSERKHLTKFDALI